MQPRKTTKHKVLEATKKKLEAQIKKIRDFQEADFFGDWIKQQKMIIAKMPYKYPEEYLKDYQELNRLDKLHNKQMKEITKGNLSQKLAELSNELGDVNTELFFEIRKLKN